MLTDYERHLILFSLANAANHFHHDDGEASELVEWLDERKNRTELGIEKNLTKDIRNLLCSKGRQPRMTVEHADPEEMSARQWRGFRQTLREKSLTAGNALYDRTAQRLRDLEGMMRRYLRDYGRRADIDRVSSQDSDACMALPVNTRAKSMREESPTEIHKIQGDYYHA